MTQSARTLRLQQALGWLVLLAAAAAAPLSLAFPAYKRTERAAMWGAVVLISMIGWGGLIARLAYPGRRVDLGLRLAWGAGGLIAAGGVLMLLTVATAPVLVVLLLGGVALALWDGVRARATFGPDLIAGLRRWPAVSLVVVGAVAVLAGVAYAAGASGAILNGNDDQAAYLPLIQKLLDTGTLVEPFSVRRLTCFGGHTFLQALATVGAASVMQAPIVDLGLSVVATLLLILGVAADDRSRLSRKLVVLPLIFIVTLENVRINTASAMSGVVFFLAMFRTATWKGFAERPRAGGVILGMLGAAACSLRHSYFVPVAMFLVVFYLPKALEVVRAAPQDRRRPLNEIVAAAAAVVLFLVPWSLQAQRAIGTFLFPLVMGNYRPDYIAFTTKSTFNDRVFLYWSNICACAPVRSIPMFLLAGLFMPWRRSRGALPALMIAGFLGFALTIWSLPMSNQHDIARYYYGFTTAAVVAIILTGTRARWHDGAGRLRKSALVPFVLVIAAFASQLHEERARIYADYLSLGRQILASKDKLREDSAVPYQKLQAKIPAGERMIVMLDDAYWFDFKRNRIDLVDLPGAASPPPGMPLDDDERLAKYLLDQGYHYLAFVHFNASKSLYKRDHWIKIRNSSKAEEIWKKSAPYYLDTFDRFDGLSKSRRVVYDDGVMVAVDLTSKNPPPPPPAAPPPEEPAGP